MSSSTTTSGRTVSILVANPNSSKSITDALEAGIAPPPGCSLGFYTGPDSAPPSINDSETSLLSETACLPELVALEKSYDAVLIACYSDHPLVKSLKAACAGKPVIGIFEASVCHALLLGRRFGIVTTGKPWEALLSAAVSSFMGANEGSLDAPQRWRNDRFAGVQSTGLGVLELHGADPKEISKRIGDAAKRLVEVEGVDVICLGCAGMSGMEEAVKLSVGPNIHVVDGVKAGLELLVGLARRG
ncbi:hypothetical protein FRB99_004269 [Tulasnella sp. 403]|nr:hypothetical protein FRB99_004269 [Tulasnella sp. 403]